VRRPVSAPVVEVEHFLRLGQCNDEWMVAPLAFVVDADSLLLLASGLDHRAVGFNGCLIEKTFLLLSPDFSAGAIDPLHDFDQFD